MMQGYFAHNWSMRVYCRRQRLKQVQAVFNQWQQESGRCLADISRIWPVGIIELDIDLALVR